MNILVNNAAVSGLKWLKTQKADTVKDISREIQALSLWNEEPSELIEVLLSKKRNDFWETETPVPDTARACSALAGCGIRQYDSINWILARQQNGSWSNNEIDTSYALIALGDAGIKNESGCEWLTTNYGKKWEFIGTTSLILVALLKQNKGRYHDFIKDRTYWLISKRQSGGWKYTATSNLAVQALILAGEKNIEPSIQWILERQKNGNWGDITSTSLSLISLKMYLNKLNSDSCL